MERLRLDVHHSFHAIRSAAAGLLHDERHWIRFVHQAKFDVQMLLIPRIHENAAVQERSVNVCDHRPDVSAGIRT